MTVPASPTNLAGVVVGTCAAAAEPSDDLSSARRRRLSSVPPDELPLGEDAIELVSDDPEPRSGRAEENAALGAEAPVEAYLDGPADDVADDVDESADDTATTAAVSESDDEPRDHDHEPPSRKQVKKTRGRASVPSWDEIMFGGPSDEGRA